jgi:outer membrane murein-binding lipoprotein Lpp
MNETLLIAFIAVTSVAVVLQTLILAGMYFATRKAGERIDELSTQVSDHVLPLVEKVRYLVDENAPAIQTAVTNLTETSTLVREQAGKIAENVTEIVDMARSRAGQADILADRTMQRVDMTAAAVQHAVLSPVRRLSALLEGVTAGVGEYVGGRKVRQNKAVPTDEMFI